MINKPSKARITIFAFLLCIITGWVLYIACGRMLITAIYEGKTAGFLNPIIEGQLFYPKEYYFTLADAVMQQLTVVIIYSSIFIIASWYLSVKIRHLNLKDGNIQKSGAFLPSHTAIAFNEMRNDLILLFFLLMSAMKFTYAIEQVMDVPMYDEAAYLYNGINLLKYRLTSTDWKPLYSIWYCILSFAENNGLKLVYLNYKIIVSLSIIAFYIYLRRIGVTQLISSIAALLFLTARIISQGYYGETFINYFAVLILLLFLILSTFSKSEHGYFFIVGLGFLVISFVRPEFFLSFIFVCLTFLFIILRERKSGIFKFNSAMPRLVALVFLSLLLLYFFNTPMSLKSRGWIAFCQHFSANYVRLNNLPISNPYGNWEQIAHSVFGDADSIFRAAGANTKEFLLHVGYNITQYISRSIEVCLIVPRGPIPALNRLVNGFELFFFIIMFLQFFLNRKKIAKMFNKKTTNHVIFSAAVVVCTTFILSAVIHPRYRYLSAQGAVITIVLSYLFGTVIRNKEARQMSTIASLVVGILIFSLVPVRGIGWCVVHPLYFLNQNIEPRVLKNRAIIKFISSLNIKKNVNLFDGYSGYAYWLGGNYNVVSTYNTGRDKGMHFVRHIQEKNINMILVTEGIKNRIQISEDSGFQMFFENPDVFGFYRLEIPDVEIPLFVRKELL